MGCFFVGGEAMEKKFFIVFIRLEDGTAEKKRIKAYTIDEAIDKIINKGFVYARYETIQYYETLRSK